MINRAYIFTVVLGLAAFILGCQNGSNPVSATTKPATPVASNTPPVAPPPSTPADDAPRITLVDAKKAFDDGTAIFVDTRAESAYKQEHVKDSINIPTGTLEANISKLSKSKKIIAYCS